ncbi:hypothetical protein F7Q99_01670 [Streptomyces kaniharaensis]|uniref:Uncharacterized protein n=1 Tax=Streptomyces kaniharaensis TaxID=212423 RepID=A0A6N7KHR1_9ACTN|nr:hypothetical protein [Streptomyces kaniharaensis]MQS11022.1 hypothetical protein [Streptomyces kaniharaensis]
MHWLAKSAAQIKLTAGEPAEVSEWLSKQLAEVPAQESDMEPVVRPEHAREFLGTFPHDVVWTYWTPGQQLRSVAAVSCPRTFNPTGEAPPPCPLAR